MPLHLLRRVLFLFPLLWISSLAQGQLALYAEYGGANFNVPSTNWIYGPTFGGYYAINKLGFLSAGIDARASLLGINTSGNGTKIDSGMVGPRIAVRPHIVPIKPYIEAVAGGAHVEVGSGSARTVGNYFEYGVIGGADLTFFPYLDWRVVDVSYSGLPNLLGGTKGTTISTGLVVRIPLL